MSDIHVSSSYIAPTITFVSGAAHGFTNVVVGQPFDTCKSRLQALPPAQQLHLSASPLYSSLQILKQLYSVEGVRGWYRGGLPMVIGGSLMRSIQFGVSAQTQSWLQRQSHVVAVPHFKILGFIDSHVLCAGAVGGMARSIVEIPTDFLKIRRQVRYIDLPPSSLHNTTEHSQRVSWKEIRTHVLDGSGVTLLRNTLLFSSFIVYIDISKQLCFHGYVPSFLMTSDGLHLSPFYKGAICANLAWITVWPLDLVKTQKQSGNFHTINNTNTPASSWSMLKYNILQGHIFRGLLPGLVRSTFANGASMVSYEWVHFTLTRYFEVQRADMV